MSWIPITLVDLQKDISAAQEKMDPMERSWWEHIRVPPRKWALEPWGDLGGGFWVVGLLGSQCLWYNDIEDGYNWSEFREFGVIGEYFCNQDELNHVMHSLLHNVQWDTRPGDQVEQE